MLLVFNSTVEFGENIMPCTQLAVYLSNMPYKVNFFHTIL